MTCRRKNSIVTVAVVLGLSVIGLAMAGLVWEKSWDDTAITLAYSRTLAETGEVRFGHHGERVEGSSTFLWMLVAAALTVVWRSPDGLLTAARLACAGFYVANSLLAYELGRAVGLGRPGRLLLVALYALSAVAIGSVADGMENHLFLALHLAAGVLYLRLRGVEGGDGGRLAMGLGVVLALMLLTRPEGVVTAGLLAAAAVWDAARKKDPASFPHRGPNSGSYGGLKRDPGPLFAARGRRLGCILGAVGVAAVVFGAFLAWRWACFGQIMPNPVYAKMHPPYWRPHAVRLALGTLYVGRFLGAALVPLVPAAILAALRGRRGAGAGLWHATRRTAADFAFFVAAFVLYAVYHWWIGGMMGTDGRVLMAVTVPMWAVLLATLARAGLRWSPATVALVLVPFLALQGLVLRRYARQPVTVAAVRELVGPGARLAARLEGRLGRTPRLATPDMGATALWWGDELELVDLALLNYREGALRGWKAVRRLMASDDRPDVVEIHTSWARASGLAGDTAFLESYVKVTVDGLFFFVRRDLLDELRASPPAWLTIRHAEALSPTERAEVLTRMVTDFRGDATRVPLPWQFALDLAPETTDRRAPSDAPP